MIHIICIKFNGRKPFNSEYVNRLFRGIKNNTSKSFLFTCFTDNMEGVTEEVHCRPIKNNTKDWFNKISLYDKNHYAENDQIFYFDLDTVITGNLDEILSYRGDFAILRDFYRKDGYGSGFMSWRPNAVNHMYTNYRGQKTKHGDQGWCEAQYPGADIWQDMYPGQIGSYKVHIRDVNGPRGEKIDTDNIRVLCFHGNPMPHEVPKFWNINE